VQIDFGDIEVVDVYPYPLPDLFAGTQLMVVGRYRQGGQTDISLTGKASNLRLEYAFEDVRFQQEGGEEFIARLWATRKIGYLLQQIRLHGEDRELVDEVVELSIRYGIVTPYTSFLVEETDRALTQEGREALADEMQTQATALPAFGQQSVERSAGEKTLSEAEAPAALAPGLGSNAVTDAYGYEMSPVKYVGDKTFVLNDGVWTDTLFDPARMKPTPVGFGSEDYFALVAARPEWGRYLAVGSHVIVVLEKTAYEIRDGEAPAVNIPPATPGTDNPPTPQPVDPGDGGLMEAVIEFVRQIVEAVVDFFSR